MGRSRDAGAPVSCLSGAWGLRGRLRRSLLCNLVVNLLRPHACARASPRDRSTLQRCACVSWGEGGAYLASVPMASLVCKRWMPGHP
eukprot:2948810-Pyramimonas_sp.AAC.1